MNIERLRVVFDESPLRKADVVRLYGVSKLTLDSFLRGGDIKVSTLEAIAKAMEVSPATFFEDSPSSSEVDAVKDKMTHLQEELASVNKQVSCLLDKLLKK